MNFYINLITSIFSASPSFLKIPFMPVIYHLLTKNISPLPCRVHLFLFSLNFISCLKIYSLILPSFLKAFNFQAFPTGFFYILILGSSLSFLPAIFSSWKFLHIIFFSIPYQISLWRKTNLHFHVLVIFGQIPFILKNKKKLGAPRFSLWRKIKNWEN